MSVRDSALKGTSLALAGLCSLLAPLNWAGGDLLFAIVDGSIALISILIAIALVRGCTIHKGWRVAYMVLIFATVEFLLLQAPLSPSLPM